MAQPHRPARRVGEGPPIKACRGRGIRSTQSQVRWSTKGWLRSSKGWVLRATTGWVHRSSRRGSANRVGEGFAYGIRERANRVGERAKRVRERDRDRANREGERANRVKRGRPRNIQPFVLTLHVADITRVRSAPLTRPPAASCVALQASHRVTQRVWSASESYQHTSATRRSKRKAYASMVPLHTPASWIVPSSSHWATSGKRSMPRQTRPVTATRASQQPTHRDNYAPRHQSRLPSTWDPELGRAGPRCSRLSQPQY